MFNRVFLSEEFKDYFQSDNDYIRDFNLAKVNIFVGANNSGKSRFARKLISKKIDDYKFSIDDCRSLSELNNVISCLYEYYKDVERVLADRNIKPRDFINEYKQFEAFFENDDFLVNYVKKGISFNHIEDLHNLAIQLDRKTGGDRFLRKIKYNNSIEKNFFQNAKSQIDQEIQLNKIYLPTLRSLRTLDYIGEAKEEVEKLFTQAQLPRNHTFDKDFFKGRTIIDYWGIAPDKTENFVSLYKDKYSYYEYEKKIDVSIITGLSLYDEISDLLLGNHYDRIQMLKWQSYLSKHYFENKPVNITPNRQEEIIKIKIGDEKEQAIYNLGDGLQTIIIITFAIFKYKNKKTWLVIEEPEMFLHPSYQRKLIQSFWDSDFNNIQFFVTTHSNHFLDLAAENPEKVLIYHFEKIRDQEFKISPKTDDQNKQILKSLGVRPSSLFLSNCIILVEGVSDIIYFKKYLELYMNEEGVKEFTYDHHYSFLEYSGSNIEHWDFLDGVIASEKISPNIFIVADGDEILRKQTITKIKKGSLSPYKEGATKKENRLRTLASLENAFILPVREVENLISPEVLRATVIKKEKRYRQQEGRTREINSDLIPQFKYEIYKSAYLGTYIDNQLREHIEHENGYTYKTSQSAGTIANKNEFARIVCSLLKSFNDLSTDAQNLTKEIYSFIDRINTHS